MTKKLKLSPWHDGRVKPVHVGVYQRCKEDECFSYWNGEEWFCLADDTKQAINYFNMQMKTYFLNEKWRVIVK